MAVFQYGGLIEQVASTATAGGTTTLLNTSKQIQVFTGSANQTIVLPDATTFSTTGGKFEIYNTSTGTLTVNRNGGTLLALVSPNASLIVKISSNATSAGTWVIQASATASSGSKNYLSQYTASTGAGAQNPGNGNFELASTSGWSLAHSAMSGTTPTTVATATNPFSSAGGVNGGSAATNLTLSTVNSGQLAGGYSGSVAASATSAAGDMLISDAFYIDQEDQAKIINFSFAYKAQTPGATVFAGNSTNTFAIWIYDVTNAAWIQPAGTYTMAQGVGVGVAAGSFQSTSNSIRYQIAIIDINNPTGAWTMYYDDLFVGPSSNFSASAAGFQPTKTIIGVGSGTYTTPTGCTFIKVTCIGSGAGGGGATATGAGQVSVGGGGGGGGTAIKYITNPSATYAYTVGAGGTGVTGAAGNSGNASTIAGMTSTGGIGGSIAGPGGNVAAPGGAGGSGGGGDIGFTGGGGLVGQGINGNAIWSGAGGNTFLAGTARNVLNPANGNSGTGPGGGGSGASQGANLGSLTGGNGVDGVIIIEEFYPGAGGGQVPGGSIGPTGTIGLTAITSGSPTVSSGGMADFSFTNVFTDTNSAYNGTTTWTCPMAGVYSMSANMNGGSNTASGGTLFLQLVKNGSIFLAQASQGIPAAGQVYNINVIAEAVLLKAGDTIKVQMNTNAAGTVTASGQWGVALQGAGAGGSGTNSSRVFAMPQITRLTTGTGATYTTPVGALYLKVYVQGGGGSGGSNAADGQAGNSSSWAGTGITTITANGGAGGTGASTAGGLGGTAANGDVNIQGGNGHAGANNSTTPGGNGGNSPQFAGGGLGAGQTPNAGGAALGNTGGGGGGATLGSVSRNGGGAGGLAIKWIPTPASTYTYTVAATKSTASAGGDGASGVIVVEAFFQ